jgi:hypothetical protein
MSQDGRRDGFCERLSPSDSTSVSLSIFDMGQRKRPPRRRRASFRIGRMAPQGEKLLARHDPIRGMANAIAALERATGD